MLGRDPFKVCSNKRGDSGCILQEFFIYKSFGHCRVQMDLCAVGLVVTKILDKLLHEKNYMLLHAVIFKLSLVSMDRKPGSFSKFSFQITKMAFDHALCHAPSFPTDSFSCQEECKFPWNWLILRR